MLNAYPSAPSSHPTPHPQAARRRVTSVSVPSAPVHILSLHVPARPRHLSPRALDARVRTVKLHAPNARTRPWSMHPPAHVQHACAPTLIVHSCPHSRHPCMLDAPSCACLMHPPARTQHNRLPALDTHDPRPSTCPRMQHTYLPVHDKHNASPATCPHTLNVPALPCSTPTSPTLNAL
ncbi:hypothetical protein OF83DRAFT_1179498 [Amylostereum chailletii]|nr:hypothetical protein OF83DRAFT_1179498 [Amylostereum chailletii]